MVEVPIERTYQIAEPFEQEIKVPVDRVVYKDKTVECQKGVVIEKVNLVNAEYDKVVYQDRIVNVELEKVCRLAFITFA